VAIGAVSTGGFMHPFLRFRLRFSAKVHCGKLRTPKNMQNPPGKTLNYAENYYFLKLFLMSISFTRRRRPEFLLRGAIWYKKVVSCRNAIILRRRRRE
jgi:hypothetical protein